MRALETTLALVVFAALIAGCRNQPGDNDPGGAAITFELTSPAFREGETIPKQYTGDGMDTSPPLRWGQVPKQAKSLAVICDDPDAPSGTWVHWVLFNLPPEVRELPEAVPAQEKLENGAHQGTNDFGKIGYGGPAPPPGKVHRYFFKVYALDCTIDLGAGATAAQLSAAMKGHVLAQGRLMGRYGR
jgi:Raf kinase inhibitor-like YbhB/YbcL family protein